jgi:DNA-binding response OmpR family regulator
MQAGVTRILIVDDDVDIQEVVQRAAKDAGYEVVQAFNGATGLVLAVTQKFDLILLDVSMPKLDGRDVLVRLRENPGTAQVPVLLFSGNNQQNDRRMGLELGADDYVDKPFSAGLLMTKIGRLIEKARERA